MASDRNLEIEKQLKKLLPKDRFQHSLRVAKFAEELAKKYGVSLKKARCAALLHDCSRFLEGKQYLTQAKKHGIKIKEAYKRIPKLVHAELSAVFARKKFDVKDPEILNAVTNHTFGRPEMGKLEKIIYLADHIEEGRKHKDAGKIRKTAFSSLDKAVLATCDEVLRFLINKKSFICDETIKTRNFFLTTNV